MKRHLFSAFTIILLFSQSVTAQLATPNPAGLTFGHIHLTVSDPEEHTRLWVEHFDAEISQRAHLSVLKFPNMIIMLREGTATVGSLQTPMHHFGFKVRNLERFLSKWRAAGLEVGPEFIGTEGQTNAYVMMPDGVYVELQEDQSLHKEITGYHIHYSTTVYKELLDWYVNAFDLEIRPRGNTLTTTNVPGMNMSFDDSETPEIPKIPTQGSAIDHVGFEVDDLEALIADLKAKGIELDSPMRIIEPLGLKIAFLTDPSGVYIELTEGLDEF